MAAYKETVPAFRYNPAVVPPYSLNNAHWFLIFEYKDNGVITYNFILIGWQAYRGDQIHRKNSPT